MTSGGYASSGWKGTRIASRLQTITVEDIEMVKREIPPIHPGEILLEEFLKPMVISQYRVAKDINVDPRRINEVIHGRRSISADTALRLARYFGTSERFWMNLQARYDLERKKMELGDRLEVEVKVLA